MQHHKAGVKFGSVEGRPFRAECSCGTAGDFTSKQAAVDYIGLHFSGLSGIQTAEYLDEAILMPAEDEEPSELIKSSEAVK